MSNFEVSRERRAGRAWPIVALLALIVVAGCGNDDGGGPTVPANTDEFTSLEAIPLDRDWSPGLLRAGYPFPADADQCVANVMDSYGERQLDPYRRMLNAAYRFVLRPEVVEEYALPDPWFDLKDETGIAWRLFTGQPSEENGRAVSEINVDACEATGTWQAVPASEPYFGDVAGAMMRNYDVRLRFVASGMVYQVDGGVVFYVVPVEVEVQGAMRTAYQLLGQVDHTNAPGSRDSASWSTVKALYRIVDPLS